MHSVALSGLVDLQETLEAISDRVNDAGCELRVVNGRMSIVTPRGRQNALRLLGIPLYNDVHVFARRFREWLSPASCRTCRRLYLPLPDFICVHCSR